MPVPAHLRDPAAIYAASFRTIREEGAEALARLDAQAHDLAIRIAHACGMVDAMDDLVVSPGAVEAGRAALAAGAPVLVDAEMVAHGVIRARLPAGNRVVCRLNEPCVPEAARRNATTRSAAQVDLWDADLGGAVVAIGNAPTALFRLLERLDDGAPRPAVILGFPVGFVGAAESKAELARTRAACPSRRSPAGAAAARWRRRRSMRSPPACKARRHDRLAASPRHRRWRAFHAVARGLAHPVASRDRLRRRAPSRDAAGGPSGGAPFLALSLRRFGHRYPRRPRSPRRGARDGRSVLVRPGALAQRHPRRGRVHRAARPVRLLARRRPARLGAGSGSVPFDPRPSAGGRRWRTARRRTASPPVGGRRLAGTTRGLGDGARLRGQPAPCAGAYGRRTGAAPRGARRRLRPHGHRDPQHDRPRMPAPQRALVPIPARRACPTTPSATTAR